MRINREDKLLLNTAEVSDLLRTTPSAIYALVNRGKIPGVIRLGRRLLFERATLLGWLREKRAPSQE